MFLKAPAATIEALDKAMLEVTQNLQRTVMDETVPVVTGDLKRSVFGVSEVSETGVIGITGSPIIYALPVEIGVKPRQRELHQGKKEKARAFERRKQRVGGTTKGFTGRRMFERALDLQGGFVEQKFMEAVASVLGDKGSIA